MSNINKIHIIDNNKLIDKIRFCQTYSGQHFQYYSDVANNLDQENKFTLQAKKMAIN